MASPRPDKPAKPVRKPAKAPPRKRIGNPLIRSLRDEGPAVEEKLASLAGWSQEPATLFGKTGPFLLMQGVHHVKLVLAGDRLTQVKAYVFMLLSGSMPAGQTSAPSSRR